MELMVKSLAAIVYVIITYIGYCDCGVCTQPGFTLSTDNNWCFAFTTIGEGWPKKSISCRMYGATLVTIEDAAKHEMVKTYLTSQSVSATSKIHLGLTNALSESNWIWYGVDGVATYLPWATSNPSSTNLYNCGYMYNGSPDYDFRNENCLKQNMAICQMKASSSTATTTTATPPTNTTTATPPTTTTSP